MQNEMRHVQKGGGAVKSSPGKTLNISRFDNERVSSSENRTFPLPDLLIIIFAENISFIF